MIFFELIILFVLLMILYFLFQGAIFVPTHKSKIAKILEFANIKPGHRACDLGSGDGRLVIALAKAGATAHGYEINPFLVWWARHKIRQAGLNDSAFIHWKSFWGANLSAYDIVIVFGISHIMARLARKFRKELKPGSKIISFIFPLPDWQSTKSESGVVLYQI